MRTKYFIKMIWEGFPYVFSRISTMFSLLKLYAQISLFNHETVTQRVLNYL